MEGHLNSQEGTDDGGESHKKLVWSEWAGLLSPIMAIVAVAVSIVTLVFAARSSNEANEIAAEALKVAENATELEFARHVYIGEVPGGFATQENESHIAVINANNTAAYEVSLEGDLFGEPAVVNIWTIQSCTGYTLPVGFNPKVVYFSNGDRSWGRSNDGTLSELNDKRPIEKKGDADPPRTFTSAGCL